MFFLSEKNIQYPFLDKVSVFGHYLFHPFSDFQHFNYLAQFLL